jgi:hypothetical protein
VLDGKITVHGKTVEKHGVGVLSSAESSVMVESAGKSRFVIIAGKPHNVFLNTECFTYGSYQEPIVQYGPFVMNTEKEIQQAMSDFQSGRNGFERALGWTSKISQQ